MAHRSRCLRRIAIAALVLLVAPLAADNVAQTLPFSQSWTNTGLITLDDQWAGVPGIEGFRGDSLTAANDVDPQTVLVADDPGVQDVIANQTSPNTLGTGGVAEFQITDPVVAMQGSGTADAPYLRIYLNTTGFQSILVSYNVRDIDGSADNQAQQVALHYRVGNSGSFTNVPGAYIADATTGPNLATLVTPVSVTLPAAADNQARVELRIMTTNATSNDEWVGIDDLSVTGTPIVADLAPTVSSTIPADGATNVAAAAALSVTFSEPVTITGTVAIVCTSSGTQNVTPTGGPTTFALPHAAFASGDGCTVTLTALQVADQDGTPTPMAADYGFDFTVAACGGAATLIHDIQGSGASSPIPGTGVTVEAVVVADFQTVSSIRGFFVEEPGAEHDADPLTSEGLFVYDNNLGVPVVVGDVVRVAGFVSEFQNQTQVSSVSSVVVCASGAALPAAVPVALPFADAAYPERLEGMRVSFAQTLTVTETFNLGRGGILMLSSARLQQPTNVVAPGAPANALQTANNLDKITLDDSSLLQNPDPVVYPPPALSALNTVRGGDRVSGLAGVLTQGNPGWTTPGNIYRVQPDAMPTFTAANPRPAAPDPVRGPATLRVSSFNVLNYFTTLDGGPDICGPLQNQDCRGADSANELTRQRDKLLQALDILDADVVGLMELENTPVVLPLLDPLEDLVNGLNALAGAGTYDYIDTGVLGGDAIRVGLIFKPAVVMPVGAFAVLDSGVDPDFDTALHRPALAQTFEEIASGGRFTAVVNHLKSKGCGGAAGLDLDQGDGQGCFNHARALAAGALATWAASDPTGAADPDVLLLGDLNAYALEDPLTALAGAGFADLQSQFEGIGAYSYVFDAQAGSLDHSLANASLLPQITGATTWHINADEPSVLDYNVEFKSVGQQASYYNADAYRTADHDPLLIGLALTPPQADLSVTKSDGPDPVLVGGQIVYSITVANAGPNTAAGTAWSDPLPAGTTFVSLAPAAGWSCAPPPVGSGGTVACSIAAFAPGSALFTVTVAVAGNLPAGTLLSNTATAISQTGDPDPDPTPNSGTATTTLLSPATVTATKSVAGAFIPGGLVTYTVVLANAGPATQWDNPDDEFVDLLPPELGLESATATAGTAVADPGTNTLTWNGSIPAGGSVTITLEAILLYGVADGTLVVNQGTAFYDADGNGTNEAAAQTDDPGTTAAGDATAFVVSAPSIQEIPTLDTLGLALLALALGLLALRRARGGSAA